MKVARPIPNKLLHTAPHKNRWYLNERKTLSSSNGIFMDWDVILKKRVQNHKVIIHKSMNSNKAKPLRTYLEGYRGALYYLWNVNEASTQISRPQTWPSLQGCETDQVSMPGQNGALELDHHPQRCVCCLHYSPWSHDILSDGQIKNNLPTLLHFFPPYTPVSCNSRLLFINLGARMNMDSLKKVPVGLRLGPIKPCHCILVSVWSGKQESN